MAITVSNIDEFSNLIKSIVKLVEGCEFNIDNDGVHIKTVNSECTMRIFLESKSATSDVPVSFCIKDLAKFVKCMDMVGDQAGESKTTELNIKNSHVIHDNHKVEFKIHLVKREIITRYITQDVKSELVPSFGLVFDNAMMKKITSITSINDSGKLYFSCKDGWIHCKVDDETVSNADSLCIPITDKFTGNWLFPVKLKVDNFRAFNLLGCKEIPMNIMTNKVIEVKNVTPLTTATIITGMLKA